MQEIKPNTPKSPISKVEAAKKFDSQRERDLEMVTGMFRFIEKPGQTLHFRFKPPYPGCEFKEYHLEDGKRYRLIRAVARHLNQGCYYVEYKRLDGPLSRIGSDIMAAGTGNESTYANMYGVKKTHRAEFRSLEFMDDDISAKPDVLEVAYL